MRRSGVRIPLAPPQADIRSGCRFFVCLGVVAVLVAVLLWRRWCSGRRECFVGPGCLVCPWAAARPRAVRAASCARRVVSKPGQAPPPPTGTAAWPSGPSGALHTGGAWSLMCDSVRRLVVRPGPAAAQRHCGHALLRPPASSTPATLWVIGQNVLVL